MLRAAVLAVLVALAGAPMACAQPGAGSTGCTSDLDGAMTRTPDADVPSVCRGGAWQPVTAPQPPADRWVSSEAPELLHGQGMRNPEMAAGTWTATPRDPSARCRAQQRDVVAPGQLSEPATVEGQPGEPVRVQVAPRMFTIELSGNCVWVRG
ncbi:hypothetical protein SAMN04489835_3541 [Mycolicibacterium rutilum]|uniref:Uncharacterized protein n=1 Tax=Mycolicibacterium rutilum TaxID=370526 RepID=A0A1H6KKP9_MYCRU|nr:hypothetical protein [Mycolicibacterium rutilum]SEH74277.1 hypothetical protein SAMN04489835_3541 [Mycolicibacterium rutilum]